MTSADDLIEIIQSQLWPNVTAEIWRDKTHHGAIWRAKIASKDYPDIATQKTFKTRAQAVAHARVVLGF